MNRLISMCAIVGGVLLAGSPVAAGEFSGNGEFVPGGPTGTSACSYSGLDEPDDVENGPHSDDALWIQGVQNYGQLVRQGFAAGAPSPGVSCRGGQPDG